MDARGLIGRGGELPWRIPEDLKRFRAMTWGKAVIMGRRTYESIGHPLDGRRLILMSRDRAFRAPDGVEVAHSVEEALAAAPGPETFVAGGAEVYRAFLHLAARLVITLVQGDYRGDTYFPPVDWNEWRLLSEEPGKDAGDPACVYRSYERVGSAQ